MLFTLMLFLDSLFFSGPAAHEIPSSKFRDLIQADKIQSLILEQDRIYGLEKAAPAADISTSEIARFKCQAGFAPHQKRTFKVFPKTSPIALYSGL